MTTTTPTEAPEPAAIALDHLAAHYRRQAARWQRMYFEMEAENLSLAAALRDATSQATFAKPAKKD